LKPVIKKTSALHLPGGSLLRVALFTLPVALALAWAPPGEAQSTNLQQATGSSIMVPEALAENGRAVAEVPGLATNTPESISANAGKKGTATNDDRKDLTVFFFIGVIVDILLVTAFLIWAVGQWSKTKNRS
jgi:hypothetical protein